MSATQSTRVTGNDYLNYLSVGYPSCSALPDCSAGPDWSSVPGQEEAPGGDGSSPGSARGVGEEVSGLQEGTSWYLAPAGGDQVGGETLVQEQVPSHLNCVPIWLCAQTDFCFPPSQNTDHFTSPSCFRCVRRQERSPCWSSSWGRARLKWPSEPARWWPSGANWRSSMLSWGSGRRPCWAWRTLTAPKAWSWRNVRQSWGGLCQR